MSDGTDWQYPAEDLAKRMAVLEVLLKAAQHELEVVLEEAGFLAIRTTLELVEFQLYEVRASADELVDDLTP